MKWRHLALLLIVLVFASALHANERAQGYCVTAAGTRSLSCTVTVYLTGTTQLATIYADNVNTPQSNPFQADPTVGAWVFYAGNARYDINLSGGNPSISPAFTISDVLLFDPQSFGPINASGLTVLSNPGNLAQDPIITGYDNLFTANTQIKSFGIQSNSIGNELVSQLSTPPGIHNEYGLYNIAVFQNLNGGLGLGIENDVYLKDISAANNNIVPSILTTPVIQGTATFANVTGIQSYVANQGAGIVNLASSYLANGNVNPGTGHIGESIGFYALDQGNIGTTFNGGVVITSQTAGANNYGIWSAPTNKDQLGNLTTGSVNNIIYVDGVENLTLAAAFAKCPISGCVIDMRGNPSALNLNTFDPGTTPVTLLLGPYTYIVTQIVLRTNLRIIGMSSTTLKQASAGTAPIALPTTGGAATSVAQHVELAGFNIAPSTSPASTSDAISLVAAGCGVGCAGGGLWYSSVHDITIQPGFGRNAIRIDGTLCDQCSATQFVSFRNVFSIRALNGAPNLYITGSYIGQMMFDTCEFDGAGEFGGSDTNSGLSNIHIDNTAGIRPSPYIPYSIKFQNTTIQGADGPGGMGIQVIGSSNVTLDNAHFEHDTTIASYTSGSWSGAITNSYIDGYSGTSGLINIDNGSSLDFHNNTMATNPPSGGMLVSGSVPVFLYWYGNMNNIGGATFSPLPNPGMLISNLPNATDSVGESRVVTDSTTISAEGQACTHTSSGPVTAIAFSNGTVWKCF